MTFHLVHRALGDCAPGLQRVPVQVERLTLEKRRWRRVAADGVEFGFDLEHALHDGDAVFADEQCVYQIEQKPEPVISIAPPAAAAAARLGWMIGNLHFRIAVSDDAILAPDDPAVRQMLEREGVVFATVSAVFRPLHGAHSHGGSGH